METDPNRSDLSFKVVIPARYSSTRLPGKPLLQIAGKPMVIHVLERAIASGASEVIVATDHPGIVDAVQQHGYHAMMTSANHLSGTDRIAEVATKMQWQDREIVVNVQGDEPLIDPGLIRDVALMLAQQPEASMSTACHRLYDKASMLNPNVVKVVLDTNSCALYFSRAPIPYPRDAFMLDGDLPKDVAVFRHIGIYAYRANFLTQFSRLAPAPIELAESLEQLRALWHGHTIGVVQTECAPASGVDTEQDLALVRKILEVL